MEKSPPKFRKTPHGITTLTPENDTFIKANYLDIPIKTMARMMGLKHDISVRTRIRQLGLVIASRDGRLKRRSNVFIYRNSIDFQQLHIKGRMRPRS